MEGSKALADSAPSEDPAKPSGKVPARAEQASTPPPKVDGSTFANTKQHVAGRQGDGGPTELFTNTKLNIALINDPKNGPRFTMTKRESGLAEEVDSDRAPESSEQSEVETKADASPPSAEAAPPIDAERSTAELAKPEAAANQAEASRPTIDTGKAMPADQPANQAGAFVSALTGTAPAGVPPAAEPPDKVPVDSSKTFVGRNGTYYDESWRWMDWRGTKRSWNWPAALSFGHWFAYRRLHLFAGLHILWLAGLAAATVNNVPILALLGLALATIGLAGLYGNTLYFKAFRRAVDHVTEHGKGDYQALRGQLAKAGGTSVIAPSVMAVLSLAAITAALGVTYSMRGGFLFNLWPFF